MTDTRNADLTFGGNDYLVYLAPMNTAAPATTSGLIDPDSASGWINLGWCSTDGGTLKINDSTKDITAAGSLEPIRTLLISSTKTVQVTFEEALNPAVRALYDNVPIASVKPDATSHISSYGLPDQPNDLRYAFVFDGIDGDKRVRLYCPNGKITDRGDEQLQTQDASTVQCTMTFYKGDTAPAVTRQLDFGGVDVSGFFPTEGGGS